MDYDALPSGVVEHLKLCLLDGIGCGLFGATQPWGRIAADTALEFSGGCGGLLVGREATASASDAAMANGTAIHGFEIDDVHTASSLHPGAVTIPAVLAAGMMARSSGREVLAALAVGYEAGLRVGICAGVSHSTSGFHVTGTAGTICSSAAAARALRLPADATADALGIGATQAGGLYGARLGAMTKRFHAGRAAQSGVMAAVLAKRGFTGARDVLESRFGGFMSTLHGQHEPETILSDLGTRWETARVGFKAYAACASAHTTVDGVRELVAQGLTAQSLDRLTVHLSRKGHINVGWRYQPRDVVSAQMNGGFAAAVTLLDGETFVDQYRVERLDDPRILALIDRIDMQHDPALDAGGAGKRHAVRVHARLTDGRELETYVEQRTGSAERPLSAAAVVSKFQRIATASGFGRRTDAICEAVFGLEKAENLSRLADLLSRA